MAYIPTGVVNSGTGYGRWSEDTSYRPQEGVDLINALRNAYQPELEAQNKGLANLYRRRGLENSGLYSNAMSQLAGEQTRALDSQALNVAQFLANQSQQARDRVYGQHMAELQPLLEAQYRPKQKGGALGGALGGLVGNMLMPGIGGLFSNAFGGSSSGSGYTAPYTNSFA